ncbi:MAG: YetF domain-containing protein [Chitinophagaceae bacterium]
MMHLLQFSIKWKELLLGGEEWSFLPEAALRSLIMFIVIVVGLRILGKRGIKQLSVFELVVIIGLGSAAGDPMFYKDVGILPALIVFLMIISLYKGITYLIGKNKKFENLVEGKPVCLIKGGVFSIENFKKEDLGADEFFAELRMQSVSQLGQIEEAIVESSGNISLFFYPEKEVRYGLPVMPGTLDTCIEIISQPGYYSCVFCGYTKKLIPAAKVVCPTCKKHEWVQSSNKTRVT